MKLGWFRSSRVTNVWVYQRLVVFFSWASILVCLVDPQQQLARWSLVYLATVSLICAQVESSFRKRRRFSDKLVLKGALSPVRKLRSGGG